MPDPSLEESSDDRRRALLYVRVSTPQQAEEGASLDAQEAELRQLAALWTPELPVTVLREEGRSARSGKKRPKYEEAIALIEAGNVAAIYATKSDRLGRSVHEYLTFLGLCHEQGTAVFTKAGKTENTATGKLLAGVLGSIAQFESDLRSERVSEVNEHIRERGEWPGGRPPWGYTRGEDRVLHPSPDAPLIRQAFERYDQGASLSAVWRFLVGAAKRERDIVRLDYVSKLLRNPTYAGWIPAKTKTGAPTLTEGRHEALVPRDLFERVQARLADNKETGYRGQSLSPFGAIARCGGCGAMLRTKRLSVDKGGYAYFRCNEDCGRVQQIPVEQLELWAVAYLSVVPDWIEAAFDSGEWRKLLGDTQEADRLASQIGELEQGRANVRALARTGALSADEAQADLEASERDLRRLREEHKRHSASEDAVRADLARLQDTLESGFDGDNIAQLWQRATRAQKEAALTTVLRRIHLLPDSIALTFTYGLPGPIYVPISRERRRPETAAEFRRLGFGLIESADRGQPSPHDPTQPKAASLAGSRETSEPCRKSRRPLRARSEGRSPSLPCAGRRAPG